MNKPHQGQHGDYQTKLTMFFSNSKKQTNKTKLLDLNVSMFFFQLKISVQEYSYIRADFMFRRGFFFSR